MLITITTSVIAQNFKSIAIKSGLTLSNQTWNYKTLGNSFKKDYRQGFGIFISPEFIDNKYFSFLIDAGYIQKGASEQFDIKSPAGTTGTNNAVILESNFNYLAISPMLKVRYERMSFIPYIIAGPRADFLLSYTSDRDFSSLESEMNSISLGLSYGGGFEFRKKHIGIMAEAQHHIDATNLINQPQSDNTSELTVRNQSILIQTGIRYYFRPY